MINKKFKTRLKHKTALKKPQGISLRKGVHKTKKTFGRFSRPTSSGTTNPPSKSLRNLKVHIHGRRKRLTQSKRPTSSGGANPPSQKVGD